MSLPNILVLYAHPAASLSRVNRRMVEATRTMPNVTINDLYEAYPDFDIDLIREQSMLAAADLVVFQHPIQWFGMPALMKEWVDLVLEHGWAYGHAGTALQGKDYLLAVTSGGPDDSNPAHGQHGHPYSVFLPPFQQMAALCGMRWNTPLIFHDARQADFSAVEAHAQAFRRQLETYPAWAGRK